jgi:hypothetical protein
MEARLNEELLQVLESMDAAELVDVIVEVREGEGREPAPPQTRNQRIAHLKETFRRKIVPLQEAIRSIGGEVTGEAWLNQTLRVRLPAGNVSRLCDHDEVASLDVPHALERDTPM